MPASHRPAHAGLNAAPGQGARGSVARLIVSITAAVILALLAADAAHAGEWVQVSCINPNQTAAGSAGWSSFAAGGGYGSASATSCGPGGSAYALLSDDAAVSVGAHETLQYTPPAGSTLTGGLLDIGMYADGYGYGASGTAVAYTPEYVDDGSNVFFQCDAGLTPCANGTNDFTGQLELPAHRGGSLYLEAGCGGETLPHLESCDEGAVNGAWSLISLWWANLRLTNTATPGGSGLGGTLLSGEARGGRELLLNATDPAGPGVYNITVQAGGQMLYDATPDSNGGACAAVGESAGALMFDGSQPCRQNETVDVPIETTAVSDGEHTLKVTVTDAAGNSSVVYDQPLRTHNAPANTAQPAITADAQQQVGQALSAEHGGWSAPANAGAITYSYEWEDCDAQGAGCTPIAGAEGGSYTPSAPDVGHTLRAQVTASDKDGSASVMSAPSGAVMPAQIPGSLMTGSGALSAAGTPNGTGAGDGALLSLEQPRRISRTFAQRALTISGRLTNALALPIGGATLEVSEKVAGSNVLRLIGAAETTANGAFSVHVPAGPSRQVMIDYRAFSTDSAYAAQAELQESVSAGVQMRITPPRTSPTGSIVLSGQVGGPVPVGGVVVELLVHYHGQWQPFRDPHTDGSGRFNVRYQFQGATGRYPFRAQALGGQSGFPYATGTSTPVTVTTR